MSAVHSARSHLQAPAVQFVLRRPELPARILFILFAIELFVLLGWGLGGAGNELVFKMTVGLVLWLLAVAGAMHWWRTSVTGVMRWDGSQWELQKPGGQVMLVDAPTVRLDLQTILLVSVKGYRVNQWGASQACWLWLERKTAPGLWPALRRALFGHAHNQFPGR